MATSCNAIVDLQTNGTSSQYDNASTPGNSVTAQQAIFAQDLYIAVENSPSPNLRADALAIEKPRSQVRALSATPSRLFTRMSMRRCWAHRPTSIKTAATAIPRLPRRRPYSAYAQRLTTGDSSPIVPSHNDETGLANKRLADAPNTLTDAQTTALGNLQTGKVAPFKPQRTMRRTRQTPNCAMQQSKKPQRTSLRPGRALRRPPQLTQGRFFAESFETSSAPRNSFANVTADADKCGVTTGKVQLNTANCFLAGLDPSAALTSDQSAAVDMLRLYTQQLDSLTQGYDQDAVTASQANDVNSKFFAVLKAAHDAVAADYELVDRPRCKEQQTALTQAHGAAQRPIRTITYPRASTAFRRMQP